MSVPAYYLGAGGLTPWDVVEAFELSHHCASAVEYVLRAGKKTPDPRGDIKKAIDCLTREMELFDKRKT